MYDQPVTKRCGDTTNFLHLSILPILPVLSKENGWFLHSRHLSGPDADRLRLRDRREHRRCGPRYRRLAAPSGIRILTQVGVDTHAD